ncbi:hypothetical protein [Brevundimonas diminuta]|uniref:hypothetical protein n=1 Tax=Brevundimonas diminuta TaxID=293 RepID=UPI003D9A89E3
MKTTLKLALLASSALFATPALAQTQPTPPEHYTLNEQGVDLVSGGFTTVTVDAAIGSGEGAISFARASLQGGWRDAIAGTISITGSTYTVSLNGVSRIFTKSGTTFTPKIADGSTFSQPATNKGVYTSPNGTVAEFVIVSGQNMSAFFGFSGYVEKVTEPSGAITNFTWGKSNWCLYWDWECYGFVPVWRIERIENNLGYGLAFDYDSNDALEDYWLYTRKKRTVAYNATVERCGTANNFCRTSTNKWPRLRTH